MNINNNIQMVYVKLKKLAQGLDKKAFEISQEMYDLNKDRYIIVEKQESKTKAKKASSKKKSK